MQGVQRDSVQLQRATLRILQALCELFNLPDLLHCTLKHILDGAPALGELHHEVQNLPTLPICNIPRPGGFATWC